MNGSLPSKIVLQWHVTDRCNLRCSHCYQDTYSGTELDLDSLTGILAQFRDLLHQAAAARGTGPVRGHVTVTGGEPFSRKDLPQLLEHLSGNRAWSTFGILTNGTSIDRETARELRALQTSFVQVSIEGTRSTHDRIRGDGSYDRAACALEHLASEGVRTLISFTAHRGNYREFPDVVRLGRRLKVRKVWADRMIPHGTGQGLSVDILSPEETREFVGIMARTRDTEGRRLFGRTGVGMDRALQFLAGGGRPYACQAGRGLITVMPDGSLYPCRRMPVSVGNVMETPLSRLYFESGLLMSLRDEDCVSEGCEACFYHRLCRGGLRCLAYAVTRNPFTADPGCWRAARPPIADLKPEQLSGETIPVGPN
jgi:radical SAM protein with 4Fe4S-binding SPASM domain